MELGHLPYKKGTYEDYVGLRGLQRLGKKKWRKHVFDVVGRLAAALEPDDIVLGGGNAKTLKELPPGCRLGDNANAFKGGFLMWEDPKSARRGSGRRLRLLRGRAPRRSEPSDWAAHEGATHATRNGRTRPDGRQHGAPAPRQAATNASSSICRRKAVEELVAEKALGAPRSRTWSGSWSKPRAVWLMVPAAAVDETIADLLPAARVRRHDHRRRQFVLCRRPAPCAANCVKGHPLCRRRHERRRVGARARLLHDDRRPERRGAAPRSDLQDARAGRAARSIARPAARRSAAPPNTAICTAGRTAPAISSRWSTTASNTASWLPTRRASIFCARPMSARRRTRSTPRRRPCAILSDYKYDFNLPRRRRGLAARQRHLFVAARSHRDRADRRSRRSRSSRAACRIQAKAAGRSRRRSTRAFRRRS